MTFKPESKVEKRLRKLFPNVAPTAALAVLYQQYSVRTTARMLKVSVSGLFNWGDRHGVVKGPAKEPKSYKPITKALAAMPGLSAKEKLNRLHAVHKHWDQVALQLGVAPQTLKQYRRGNKLMRTRDTDRPHRNDWVRRLAYDKEQNSKRTVPE